MSHVVRGWGGLPRSAVVAVALTLLGVLAFSVPALGAGGPPPGLRPDPPPKANRPPPPPPPQASAPTVPQPAAPVAAAPVAAPSVVHPTVAERRAAAERRVAAARRAQRKAVRAARARAGAAKKLAAAHRRERAQAPLVTMGGTPSSNWGLPFVLVTFCAALLMLGLALTPARAVPWSRASRVLEDRRDELGVMGAMGLVATVIFFLLVQVTK